MGYIVYKIEQGDNIYKIIENYNISIERIISANPKINIYNIMPGMEIVIPVRSIVNTKVEYTSNILEEDIRNLKLIYPFLEIGEIGRSVLNKSIPYIKIGNGNKKVFYSAAFHANEWITSPVLMKFLEEYAQAFVENKNIFGYNAQALYYATSLYIVPMVNPDGVDLVTGSIKNVENAYKNAVVNLVNSYNIKLLLDIHSSTFKDNTDIDIVTNNRETLRGMDYLFDRLKELGVKYNIKIDENNVPNKEKENEIINVTSLICDIPAMRIVINNKRLETSDEDDSLENIINLMEEFISYFNYS